MLFATLHVCLKRVLLLAAPALLSACGGSGSQDTSPSDAPVVEWARVSAPVTANWERAQFSWKIRNDTQRTHTCRLFLEGDTAARELINDCTSASTAGLYLASNARNRVILLVNDDRGGRTQVDIPVLTGSAARFYRGESGTVFPTGELPTSSIRAITVNTTDDTPDQLQGDGLCADASGACSLRAAIMEANRSCDATTRVQRCDITVPAGLFVLTAIDASAEDDALTGDLNVHGWITLRGAGQGQTVIDGNAGISGDRIFRIHSKAVMAITDLSLQNTRVTLDAPGAGRHGGAVLNFGDLTLERVSISNTAVSQYSVGGAIFHYGRRLVMRDVQIHGGEALRGGGVYVQDSTFPTWMERVRVTGSRADEGGGLFADGDLNADGLVLEDNQSRTGGGLFVDRGTQVRLYSGSVSLNRITGNGVGGGIYNQGWLFMQNVSVLSNRQTTTSSATVGGAGVFDYGLVELAFVTLAGNVLTNTGSGDVQGVGLFLTDRSVNNNGDSTRMRGVIMADNQEGDGTEANCRATGSALRSDGGNVLSSSMGCVFTAGPDDTVVSLPALDLGEIQADGVNGAYRTPGAFSVASGRVGQEACTGIDGDRLVQDQRARQRASDRCSAGAVEVAGGPSS